MDDDVSLPRSTLQKAVKGGLPSGMRIASDAMDVLTLCCNEFVHLVSAQSNVISDLLEEFRGEQRQHRVGARKVSQESLSKEQLLELQQQLFAAARERSQSEPAAPELKAPAAPSEPEYDEEDEDR
ncbi:hypothetical protein QBZ16_005369 [Prototheca wickerhamii]|uniref:Transcription factor CBF/NF-Y/archaeal histone domain-containing protein n=1 Tax=Prototheca wickerhamii TaxID=3111 RepID=A0AAD9IE65_PROWI|nr:hypothetical protein QBZ16_005369 [Prototheca wickerhamii]